MPSIEKASVLELKTLPSHLKYAYLGKISTLPMIVSIALTSDEENKLLRVLKEYKKAFWWSIVDIKGINLSICTHKILMKDKYKPSISIRGNLIQIWKMCDVIP